MPNEMLETKIYEYKERGREEIVKDVIQMLKPYHRMQSSS